MSNDFRSAGEPDLFDRGVSAVMGLIIGGIASGLLVYFFGAPWPKLVRFSIVIFSTFGLAYYLAMHCEVAAKIWGSILLLLVFLFLAGVAWLIWALTT